MSDTHDNTVKVLELTEEIRKEPLVTSSLSTLSNKITYSGNCYCSLCI